MKMTAKNKELRPVIEKILSEIPVLVNKREYENELNKCETVEEKLRLRAEVFNLDFEDDAFDLENPDNWDGDQMYGFKV